MPHSEGSQWQKRAHPQAQADSPPTPPAAHTLVLRPRELPARNARAMVRLNMCVLAAVAAAAVITPAAGVWLPHSASLRSVLSPAGIGDGVASIRFLQVSLMARPPNKCKASRRLNAPPPCSTWLLGIAANRSAISQPFACSFVLQAQDDTVTNPEEANEKEVEAAAGGGGAASAAGQVTGGGAADTSVAAKGGDDGVDSAKDAALAKTQEERRTAREEKAKAELAGGDSGTDALASVGTVGGDGGVSQEAKADAAAEDITGVADSSSDQAAALSQENQGASLTSSAVGAVNAGSSSGGGAEAGGDASASTGAGASSAESLVTVTDQDAAFL